MKDRAVLTVVTGRMPETPTPPSPAIDPATIDRWADFMLHHGFRKQAERLAHRAAELREAGR